MNNISCMENYFVVKRDGSKAPLNINKIKEVIKWAAKGIDVNTIELESTATLHMKDGIRTSDIQKILISSALNLTNLENNMKNLNWRLVAAKLNLLDMYKKAKITRNFKGFGYGQDFAEFVHNAVENNIYDSKIIEIYTDEELREVAKEIKMEFDFTFDYAGTNLLLNRYLMKKEGNVYELPQEMYLTISLLLASSEKKSERLEYAKKFYNAIAKKEISPATPILLNLRRPRGNLTSCFITAMDDSLTNIYYTLDQAAQISKNAGGVGINVSRIRGNGASIREYKGVAGGVTPWVKLVNDTAIAVNQLGSRQGAITVALDIWHKDIYQFLDLQTENGDQRKKCFDIFPQIVVNDLFMERVEKNEDWTLLEPHEILSKKGIQIAELYGEEFRRTYINLENDNTIKLKEKTNARNLFKQILKTLVETGLPFIFFKDVANEMNPNKHCGMIGNANLCTESFSNFKPSKVGEKNATFDNKSLNQKIELGEVHTCNLVSLNLAILEKENIPTATKLATRMLDNAIDLTKTPIPESQKHNDEYRILGIGCLGLADYLAKNSLDYTKESDHVEELFELIALSGVQESNKLSEERGHYQKFKGSEWSKGILFGKDKEWFEKNSKLKKEWVEIINKIKFNGIRNGGLFAIAPNTSTSLLLGVSASILPIYKKFFIDKNKTGAVPICPPYLSPKTFWFYKENQTIDQKKIIEMVSKIQKWTDQGISMELVINLNMGIKAKDLYDYYIMAWKKKCKAVYYIRSITLNAENKRKECVSCAN